MKKIQLTEAFKMNIILGKYNREHMKLYKYRNYILNLEVKHFNDKISVYFMQ